jgi:putative ABC transport system substrate-binding protein
MATRRQILLASAVAALAPGVLAQSRKVPRVGILHSGSSKESPSIQREPFERGLRELGWQPGSNIVLDYRYAEGDVGKLPDIANELVRSGADVIIARANNAIAAARKASSTIPIVMAAYSGDPEADGVVNSTSRPGGNLTGHASLAPQLHAKRLELLREAFPKIKRVAMVWNPALAGLLASDRLIKLQNNARSLGLELTAFEIRRADDIDNAFGAIGKARVDALYVHGDPQILDPNRVQVTTLARQLGIPAMYEWPLFVDVGGLMSYGDNLPVMHHRSASYVSRILKGEKPGDMPVERASKFDLVVNLKTAKALRLEIPKAVMFRVDRVVE